MPFNVEEFQDLIRLLQERPEWRADLRRLVLTDELLALPESVRELVQGQQRLEVRVGRLEEALIALTEAQQRTEVRVGRLEEALIALTEAQQRTEVRVGQLEESLESLRAETERRFQELAASQLSLNRGMDDLRETVQTLAEQTATLTTDVRELKGDVGELKGDVGELKADVGELKADVGELKADVGELKADVSELKADVSELKADVIELKADVIELKGDVIELKADVGELKADVRELKGDVGELKGSDLERRYRERPFTYFQRLIRQGHTLSGNELNAMLDRALTAGQLTDEDVDEIVWADAIVRGRRRGDNQEVFLVVEVSWGVGLFDVQRADRRAKLLAKAGVTTVPVVAGLWVTPDGEIAARATGVWCVTDGRAVAPEQS